jgi:hypothetical protein
MTRSHVEDDIFDGYDGSQIDFIHTAGYDVVWRQYAHCADGTAHAALRFRRLDGRDAVEALGQHLLRMLDEQHPVRLQRPLTLVGQIPADSRTSRSGTAATTRRPPAGPP